MTQLTNALTEKGVLKSAIAKNIKGQGKALLGGLGFVEMENGRMAMQVAEADGKVITLNIDLTVGCDTDFSKKEKAPKAPKAVEAVNVPSLFE